MAVGYREGKSILRCLYLRRITIYFCFGNGIGVIIYVLSICLIGRKLFYHLLPFGFLNRAVYGVALVARNCFCRFFPHVVCPGTRYGYRNIVWSFFIKIIEILPDLIDRQPDVLLTWIL